MCLTTAAAAQEDSWSQEDILNFFNSNVKKEDVLQNKTPANSQKTKTKPVALTKTQVGDTRLSLLIGANLPTSDMNDVGLDKQWGSTGISGGLQLFHFVTENVALGAEFHYTHFQSGDPFYLTPLIQAQPQMNVTNYMFAPRIYIDTGSNPHIYIPIGIGFANMKGKLRSVRTISLSSNGSFAYYIGLGLEIQPNKNEQNILCAAEFRYNHTKFVNNDYGRISLPIEYVSLLLHIDFKI